MEPSRQDNTVVTMSDTSPNSSSLAEPSESANETTTSSRQTAVDNIEKNISLLSSAEDSQLRSANSTSHALSSPDISGDRVFPIRSVVRVDTSSNLGAGSDHLPHLSDAEGRGPGIPVHVLGNSRTESASDSKKHSGQPSPVSSTSPCENTVFQSSRQRAYSGPYSSLHADASRKGNAALLSIHLNSSGREDEDADSDLDLPDALGEFPTLSENQSVSQKSDTHSTLDNLHISTRFRHEMTKEGHVIIDGRSGTLQHCEDEPIHTPGAVQGFGVILAMREQSKGCFIVTHVSENSKSLLGLSPRQLFRLPNFLDILTEEQQNNLLDHIDFIRDEDADPIINGPEVFSLSVRAPKSKKGCKLWCAIHINAAHPDLIICEFEREDDREFSLYPTDDLTPKIPHDSLHSNPTLEEIEESTEILSKPLRVLRSARKKRGEQGAMQVFDIMAQVQEQLSSAKSLQNFLKVLVGIVKELTGFHRVMIYQFDSSFNGKVVAELVDTSQTVDLYQGLHFPASDIPRQARDLYKLNKVRLLYDRELQSARIVCRSQQDLEVPLDMTHAYLRAMSPIHLKYLGNMGVRSSMSISINAFGELWGLIACHSYGPHGMRVSFPIRKLCRLVGDTASRNIERLSYASRLQARKLINTAPTEGNPAGYIIASSEDLLRLFDADFGLLSIKGETQILGVVEQSQEALVMLEYLRMRRLTSVVASQDIQEDFPDLKYAPGFQVIAGLLYVPLSVGGQDFIAFFRKGQIKQVKWAGNPYEKTIREGTADYLEPRTSFEVWQETVAGKCREWVEEQVETAAVLCLVYGKFIEVWRQKEAALQSSKFTRILLANSAHEVRTPLNAIINYLEIALEGSLDQETRDNLAKSHSASKSLIYVINDLLDLTKAEEGKQLVKFETFELPLCIKEATDPFRIDAERKGIDYHVKLHPGLPRFVHGDGRQVRQAVSNITANAISYTTSGYVRIDVYVSEIRDQEALVEIVVTDSGTGLNPQQLDALFRELEQVSSEEPSLSSSPRSKTQEIRTLGLGLAVVARTIRNMNGQLRLKSFEGQGSRFVVQLPFQLLEETLESQRAAENTPTVSAFDENSPSLMDSRTSPEGKVLFFDASGISIDEGVAGMPRKRSLGSRQQSDTERLIDTLQTPIPVDESPSDYFQTKPLRRSGFSFAISPRGRQALGTSTESEPSPGTTKISDTKTPIHAVKVPDAFTDMPALGSVRQAPRNSEARRATEDSAQRIPMPATTLRVLVAEDDPINVRVLKKRLEKAGHEVYHAVNGENCATMYREKSTLFDAILMDIQMPIVDGIASTRMIRAIEKSPEHAGYSKLAAACGQVPIFAVSASLVEHKREMYMTCGFDGWILKPIDFKRLSKLLEGIWNAEARTGCLYTPGEWERGGWFGPSAR